MNWKVIALAIGVFVISIVISKIAGGLIIEYVQWAQGIDVSF